MNYYKKIFNYLLSFGILISINFSQNMDVELTLLNTGAFTLNTWNNEAELWYVEVTNNSPEPVYYRLQFQLYIKLSQNDYYDLLVEGMTEVLYLGSNDQKTYQNLDNELNQNSLETYNEVNPYFISNIENITGYMPAGDYKLTVSALESDSPYLELASDQEEIIFQVGNNFDINNPYNEEVFPNGEDFYFAWDTPGFREGVKVEFRLIISAIIPEDTDSPEDAIDLGYNNVFYYDSDWSQLPIAYTLPWPYIETGASLSLAFYYSQLIAYAEDMVPLQCGFDYAWRVDAREVIDEPPFNGEGIWGWPEPVQSVVRKFTWGEVPELVSPVDNEELNDVLPFFEWNDNVVCADEGFEIEISLIDDEDFTESWGVDFITSPFQYYADATGLIPGESYKWRIRINSSKGNTKWSEFETFTIQDIELIEPQNGITVESVRPYFNISAPENISHYEILIGDENDEYVEQVEVYNREQVIATLPWQYPSQDIENGLFPNMVYYWKLLMFDGSGNILGDIEDYEVMGNFRVMPIILSEPSNNETNIPLNQKFVWDGPLSVPSYEFWLSDINDPEVVNPNFIMNSAGSESIDYPEAGDFPLENEESYYWKIVPKDINNNYGLPSSHSIVYQFTALDFPVMGEEVTVSNSDVRIPIITIETSEGVEYTIFIYDDPDGSSIIEEIVGITNFPFEYSNGIDKLQYGTIYYIQIQPTKNGEDFGPPSTILPFPIPEAPENTEQCEISCEVTDNTEPEILVSILAGLEEAAEYLILISQNEDMSNPFEYILPSNEFQEVFGAEYVDWGNTYYTQVVALSPDGSMIGLASEIQMVNVESKPGTNEQTAIAVSLPEGSLIPQFEIINEITGASGYRIIISPQPDMSAVLFKFDVLNSINVDYPSNASPLQYGGSYYVTAQGLDGDDVHGIISSIVGFFIPNITPPILGEAFSWESTVPKVENYLLQMSFIEDFSALELTKYIEGNSYPIDMDELEYNSGYYWRVTGLDAEGNSFGSSSQISFYQTAPVPAPTLNAFSEEETSLTPEFSWSGIDIDMVTGYQITVSNDETTVSDGRLKNIFWQNNTANLSAIYPESAKLLEFSTTYYWMVATLDATGNVLSLSSIQPFSTRSVYPILGLKPDGGSETLSPVLEWEGNLNSAAYLVNVGLDSLLNNKIISEQVNDNSFPIEDGLLNPGTKYYWTVDGLDESGESLAGPSTLALILTPSSDDIISLISPIGDAQVNNLNPVIKWGAVLGITSYILRVSTEPEFENLVIDNLISGNETTISDENRLNSSTTYYWQVEATTETDVIISDIESFVTPSSTELNIQKLNDEEVISVTNPTFSWEAVEGISAFSIRFSDTPDFSENWPFQIGTTNFQYPGEPPLNYNIPYYWQIIPLNNEGSPIGEWTEPRTFSINTQFIVELELPGNGEVATTSNPTFKWGIIEDAIKYEIQVSNVEDFSEIMWSTSEIINNSTEYPQSGAEPLNYDQSYYWRVRALGEESPLGDFSVPFSFSLSGENKVVLEGPLEETSESLSPYFSWFAVSGTSFYTLTLASDVSVSSIIYSTDVSEVFFQYSSSAPPLENGITLYWQVIAKDENGVSIGDASNVGSFSTPDGSLEIEFMFGN